MVKKAKKLLPKVLPQDTLKKIEIGSAARLDDESIAAMIDCSLAEFSERKENDLAAKNAYLKGRAEFTQNCVAIVMARVNGKAIGNPPAMVTNEQYEAAKFYLQNHAENWMKD